MAVLEEASSRIRTTPDGLLRRSYIKQISPALSICVTIPRCHTYHSRLLDTAIHLDPFHVIGGDKLPNLYLTPFAIGKFGVMESIRRRWVVEKLLNGSLGKGRVSLPGGRGDIAKTFNEALSVTRPVNAGYRW